MAAAEVLCLFLVGFAEAAGWCEAQIRGSQKPSRLHLEERTRPQLFSGHEVTLGWHVACAGRGRVR
jgi:hypothetical protein